MWFNERVMDELNQSPRQPAALRPEVQQALVVLAHAGLSAQAFGQAALELYTSAPVAPRVPVARPPSPPEATPAPAREPEPTAPAAGRGLTPPAASPVARPTAPQAALQAAAPSPSRPAVRKHAVVKVYRADGTHTTICLPPAQMLALEARCVSAAAARERVRTLAAIAPASVSNLSGWVQERLLQEARAAG